MGSPLGPVFANIFLSYHESEWINNCPVEFKPAFYRRYVDDTFLLFKNPSSVEKFVAYLNTKHPNMRFTHESENDESMPFIGINVSRKNGGFDTSVYRKTTFSGLFTNYELRFTKPITICYTLNLIKSKLFLRKIVFLPMFWTNRSKLF